MTRTIIKVAFCSLAGLTVSGCAIPNFIEPEPAPAVQQVAKPVAVKPVAAKPAVAQPAPAPQPVQAAEVVEPEPVNPWAHQRIGATPSLSDGDESGGWGG
ncbi:MAG: hypothetical protein AAF230_07400 [Pseudomonadota bacterium]